MRDSIIELPVGRTKALTRALLYGVPAVPLVLCSSAVYERLQFVPTAFSNRLVDYAMALLFAMPLLLLAVLSVMKSLSWLVLASWPGKIGVFAGENELRLQLGPFGTRCYDPKALDIRYPFEMADEEHERAFEAFLPEQEQRRRLLPRMCVSCRPAAGACHELEARATMTEPVEQLVLRFASGTESEVAATLRPMIDRWREDPAGGTAESG